MTQEQIRAISARLEAALAALTSERHTQVTMSVLSSGRDAWTLRENAIAEENRRSGLRGIEQSIAGIEQQIAFHRGLLR